MRGLVALLGLAALGVVALMSLGMLSIELESDAVPTVHFDTSKIPGFSANS